MSVLTSPQQSHQQQLSAPEVESHSRNHERDVLRRQRVNRIGNAIVAVGMTADVLVGVGRAVNYELGMRMEQSAVLETKATTLTTSAAINTPLLDRRARPKPPELCIEVTSGLASKNANEIAKLAAKYVSSPERTRIDYIDQGEDIAPEAFTKVVRDKTKDCKYVGGIGNSLGGPLMWRALQQIGKRNVRFMYAMDSPLTLADTAHPQAASFLIDNHAAMPPIAFLGSKVASECLNFDWPDGGNPLGMSVHGNCMIDKTNEIANNLPVHTQARQVQTLIDISQPNYTKPQRNVMIEGGWMLVSMPSNPERDNTVNVAAATQSWEVEASQTKSVRFKVVKVDQSHGEVRAVFRDADIQESLLTATYLPEQLGGPVVCNDTTAGQLCAA